MNVYVTELTFSPPCYFPPPIEAIIQGDFNTLHVTIAICKDGEARDRGEKLGRESSTQYLQVSSLGGDSYSDEEDEELLRIIMK